jgi:signal-transduction protein with cAMP-binding, CBS, and nucleotidyltransferase domain
MIADGVTRFLRQYLPFAQMEQAALEFLVANLDLGYYPAGTAILDPAQAGPKMLYIIQRGTVPTAEMRSRSASARENVFRSAPCWNSGR